MRFLFIFIYLSFYSISFLHSEFVNNGQYVLKPISRFDLRMKYQEDVDRIRGQDLILTARTDQVFTLPRNWTTSIRMDYPYEWFKAHYQKQLQSGHSLIEMLLITPSNKQIAYGYGLKIIFPTAGNNLNIGDGKYQLLPTFAIGYEPINWSKGSNIGLLVRQAVDVAGYASAPHVYQTFIQPFINLNLKFDWFLSFSPELIYNWVTHAWFIPFDLTIGKLINKRIVLSLNYDYAPINQFPQYRQQIEFRIGYFF